MFVMPVKLKSNFYFNQFDKIKRDGVAQKVNLHDGYKDGSSNHRVSLSRYAKSNKLKYKSMIVDGVFWVAFLKKD